MGHRIAVVHTERYDLPRCNSALFSLLFLPFLLFYRSYRLLPNLNCYLPFTLMSSCFFRSTPRHQVPAYSLLSWRGHPNI